MASIIQIRRDVAATWTSTNPVLASGEIGLEVDTRKLKFGDGVTAWSSLSYFDAGAQFDLVNDTTPQLGGDLDLNGNVITGMEIGTDIQAYDATILVDADIGTSVLAPTGDGSGLTGVGDMNDVVDDTTPQLGGDLDCNGNQIFNDTYLQAADASLGTGTHTFDATATSEQQLTATGNITLAFTFTTGVVGAFIIDAVNFGAHTITLPAGMLFNAATAPTFTAAGRDKLLVTHDKDDILEMYVIGQEIA